MLITGCDLTTIWKSTHHSTHPPGWLICYGRHSIKMGLLQNRFPSSSNHSIIAPLHLHARNSFCGTSIYPTLHVQLWTGPPVLIFLWQTLSFHWQLWAVGDNSLSRGPLTLTFPTLPHVRNTHIHAHKYILHSPLPRRSFPGRAEIPSSLSVSVAVAILTSLT